MSAATPGVVQKSPDRRLGIAVGVLTLAVALLVGGIIVRQAGQLSTAPSTGEQTLSVGGYTGIPYTPTRQAPSVSVGGYTGIPYTPTRQAPADDGGAGASSRTYSGQ